jgi:uncharacterized membrane protein
MNGLLHIHIAAGALALILGAVALLVRKGGTLHRRSGQLFVGSMIVMGITASVLGNIGGGLMSAYFVVTALTTVRPVTAWTRWVNGGALAVIAVLALGTIAKGFTAMGSPGGVLNGVPFFMLFFIGSVMALAAVGDIRVMWWGPLRGGPRLARHLWRMCFGLFIAAGSFLSIQARVARILPEPFTTPAMRILPIALIFIAMFYWLWRVRGRRNGISAIMTRRGTTETANAAAE